MAVTEPRPAHYDGAPPADQPPATNRRRHPWRRRSLLAAGTLLAAAVTVLGVLAGTYQPIEFGGQWSTASGSNYFPELPSGTGLRSVNTFAAQTGQLYVPPQSGVFTIAESIYNNGPKPVTIEAVSILSPQNQAYAAEGESPWPLVPAGPVHWTLQIQGLPHTGPGRGASVAGVTLRPGQGMLLGFPLRLSRRWCLLHRRRVDRHRHLLRQGAVRALHPLGDGSVPAAPDHARAAGLRPEEGSHLPGRRHALSGPVRAARSARPRSARPRSSRPR